MRELRVSSLSEREFRERRQQCGSGVGKMAVHAILGLLVFKRHLHSQVEVSSE